MSIHGVLGETTRYPKHYHPQALFAIPRSQGRDVILRQYPHLDSERLAVGVDWWHAFEISWLNKQGVSQVALARFAIPASSPNIVESKSLKLYLNSLNFTEFASRQAVTETISKDLRACVGADVQVSLFELNAVNVDSGLLIDQAIDMTMGQCIDQALDGADSKIALTEHPDANLLTKHMDKVQKSEEVSYQLYSNLLRSNCPVTDQPDWGTVAIEMSSRVVVNEANLLSYVLSFRQHNGFHEQCVEQIFADLTACFAPSQLVVRAWYTRRGGIDINPCRVSDIGLLPMPSRLVRQ